MVTQNMTKYINVYGGGGESNENSNQIKEYENVHVTYKITYDFTITVNTRTV